MHDKIYLCDEFAVFMDKIRSGENFTLMRFADGERAVMENASIKGADGWTLPGRETSLGAALRDSLTLEGDNVYYGISCPCCDREAYYWYMSRIRSRKNITFSNIFVNRNYRTFLSEFPHIKRDAVVIANHRGMGKNIGNLNILAYYPVGDECVNFWEDGAQELITRIKNDFGSRKNLLYVVSAGPMSEPIIASLYRNNPCNSYIDFGSSISVYIHGRDIRSYSRPGNVYAERNCWMFNPIKTDFNVSVILTSYKKPDALSKQIEAIENQSLKPSEIYLFQDGITSDYDITFRPEILRHFTGTFISPVNLGVWERFRYAMNADSEYVCIFDDDTIPGKRWLENCHYSAQIQDGIYGTIGVIIKKPEDYPFRCWKTGWGRPYSGTARVDFAGHSWFLRRKYLGFMFDGTEKYQKFKYLGEDMCLSFKCLQHGIKTFIPPHPYYDMELWGSLPEYGDKYGNDSGAISKNNDNLRAMSEIMKLLASEGWKFCINDQDGHTLKTYLGSEYGHFMMKVKRKLAKFLGKRP